jgi:hypothetical protein
MTEEERDTLVHTLGNLTLLTSKLNAKVSNSAWMAKRIALAEHDVLKLNADLLARAGDAWDDAKVQARTQAMAEAIVEIWPVPEGHRSGFSRVPEQPRRRVGLADLIGAGLLEPGTTVYARSKAQRGRTATVLPDGFLDVDGQLFTTPSGAARSMTGTETNGWWFFVLAPGGRRSLSDVLQEYVDQTAEDGSDLADVEIADADEEDDGEDEALS